MILKLEEDKKMGKNQVLSIGFNNRLIEIIALLIFQIQYARLKNFSVLMEAVFLQLMFVTKKKIAKMVQMRLIVSQVRNYGPHYDGLIAV